MITFLAGVLDHVPGQVLLAEEGLVAVRALDGLGALMHELDVRSQPNSSIKGPVAVRTSEGVLASVVEDVRPKLDRLDEGLPAELAGVRLLARVRPHVPV